CCIGTCIVSRGVVTRESSGTLCLTCVFLVLLRRPATCTLFPYTTLFRSVTESGGSLLVITNSGGNTLAGVTLNGDLDLTQQQNTTEAHTAGLQPRGKILCGMAHGRTNGRAYFGTTAAVAGSLTGSGTVAF